MNSTEGRVLLGSGLLLAMTVITETRFLGKALGIS